MIKTAAVLLIIAGFVFSGQSISSFQQKKADTLSEIVMMITFMQNRLSYDCLPLAALLKAMRETEKGKRLEFVSVCTEKIEKGVPFSDAWRESIEGDYELCRLIGNSVSYLVRFGEDLGTTDLEGQLSCCGYYEAVFRNEVCEKKEQNKKYSKLYPALGAMLGIWAAILII